MLEEQLFELTKKTIVTEGGRTTVCCEGMMNCVCSGFVVKGFGTTKSLGYAKNVIGKFVISNNTREQAILFEIKNSFDIPDIDGEFIFHRPLLLSVKIVRVTFYVENMDNLSLSSIWLKGYSVPQYDSSFENSIARHSPTSLNGIALVENQPFGLLMNKKDKYISQIGDDYNLSFEEFIKKYPAAIYVGVNSKGDCINLLTDKVITDDENLKNQFQNVLITLDEFHEGTLVIKSDINKETRGDFRISESTYKKIVDSTYGSGNFLQEVLKMVGVPLQADPQVLNCDNVKFKFAGKEPTKLSEKDTIVVDFIKETITCIFAKGKEEVPTLSKPILVKFSFAETDKGVTTLNSTFVLNGVSKAVLIASETSLSINPVIAITPMLEVLGLTEYPLNEVLFQLPNKEVLCVGKGDTFNIGFLHKTISINKYIAGVIVPCTKGDNN